MENAKEKNISITYEVWYGPKEMSAREVKSFKAINSSKKAVTETEKKAKDFFHEKELSGMNVDVFKEEVETIVTRKKLTD